MPGEKAVYSAVPQGKVYHDAFKGGAPVKKILAILSALLLTGCAAPRQMIRIWVAENTLDFTRRQAEIFMAEHPEYAAFTVVVEPVGEGDAANNMLTDVDSGADLYVFAQDQLARLASAGALVEVEASRAERIRREHDPSAVEAASLGGVLYALPMTADNGYFLYYDKSVVSDPTRLEAILEDCRRAGKRFYMEINNGWYQPAFFFGAGAVLRYDTDEEGRMIGMDCTYASSAGLRALRALIDLAAHPAFVNGSSASNATNMGALVSGVWDQAAVQSLLGENYAAAALPTVAGWQLGGFSGCKLLGVKPQTDARKLAACDALAAWLTSGEVQLARYREPAIQWGPSHTLAQAETGDNLALSALRQQAAHATVQGQYPNEYWNLASALGDDILARCYAGATDEELMRVLVSFQTTAGSYVDAPSIGR